MEQFHHGIYSVRCVWPPLADLAAERALRAGASAPDLPWDVGTRHYRPIQTLGTPELLRTQLWRLLRRPCVTDRELVAGVGAAEAVRVVARLGSHPMVTSLRSTAQPLCTRSPIIISRCFLKRQSIPGFLSYSVAAFSKVTIYTRFPNILGRCFF